MTEEHKYPPVELMSCKRWIIADKNKKPIPGTAAKDSSQWMNYDTAIGKPEAAHLGFSMFDKPKLGIYRLVVIDIDSCIVKGVIAPWAQRIVDHFESYAERSPSGTGLHVFVLVDEGEADYPGGKHYIGGKAPGNEVAKAPQVQVIGGAGEGYVTVTGDMIEGVPDTITRVPELEWLATNYPLTAAKGAAETFEQGYSKGTAELTDEQIRYRIQLPDALVSEGDWEGFKSPSEAWFKILHCALTACHRDGERTLEFMLSEELGVWSMGVVQGGTDPAKYAKCEWVRNRVLKATGNTAGERPEFTAAEPTEPVEDEQDEFEAAGLLRPSVFRQRFGTGAAFLIDDFLPSKGVVQIYGKEKHGKSLWAMAIAYAVASPDVQTCFGMDVFDHGPVTILVGEDQFGVSGRTTAQEMLCKVGSALNHDEVDIWLTKSPGSLTTPEGMELLKRQMALTKPKLLIIDTQIANAGGIDENNTKEMAELFRNCERIANQCNCVVLLIHHMAKSGNSGARGSGVQGGAVVADFQATLSGGTAKLMPRNAKNWLARNQLRGTIQSVPIGTKGNGEPLTAPAIDYRVDLTDDTSELDEDAPEVVGVAEGEGGETPQSALVMITATWGPLKRAEVRFHMSMQGHIPESSDNNALRRLERALVDDGKLVVETRRGTAGGVLYTAP